MGAANVGRTANVALNQTQRNLRPGAAPEMRAREGFQQRGPAFERFMQDSAARQRASAEINRRIGSPFG